MDGKSVLQIRRLKWKFRGNERIEVEGGRRWFGLVENGGQRGGGGGRWGKERAVVEGEEVEKEKMMRWHIG